MAKAKAFDTVYEAETALLEQGFVKTKDYRFPYQRAYGERMQAAFITLIGVRGLDGARVRYQDMS